MVSFAVFALSLTVVHDICHQSHYRGFLVTPQKFLIFSVKDRTPIAGLGNHWDLLSVAVYSFACPLVASKLHQTMHTILYPTCFVYHNVLVGHLCCKDYEYVLFHYWVVFHFFRFTKMFISIQLLEFYFQISVVQNTSVMCIHL